MRYANDFKYAAVIIAREIGTDATADMLQIAPETLKRWMDSYEARITVSPSGSAMRNIIAAALFDMIVRLSNAINSADLTEVPIHQLAVALGIMIDKWAILATMAGNEQPSTIEALRRVVELPGEVSQV